MNEGRLNNAVNEGRLNNADNDGRLNNAVNDGRYRRMVSTTLNQRDGRAFRGYATAPFASRTAAPPLQSLTHYTPRSFCGAFF